MTQAQTMVVDAMKAGEALVVPMRRGMQARLQNAERGTGRPVSLKTVEALESAGLIRFNPEVNGWVLA